MSNDESLPRGMEPLRQRPQEFLVPPRMQYRSRPVSVAVDPVSLVISECISITSEIQKRATFPHSSVSVILGGSPNHAHLGSAKPGDEAESTAIGSSEEDGGLTGLVNRWGRRLGLPAKKGGSVQDNPMIASFWKLRHELAGVKDIHTFDAPSLLNPFLQVIQTKGTAAPITILALGALRKMLAYGFICPESPRFSLGMRSLSAALAHCQFSDSGHREVVFLMVLNLMEDMMSGPGGDILSDESICLMMERGLTICSQPRFSAVLRQTAEASMVRMCQIIFEDIKYLEVDAGEEMDAFDKRTNGEMDTVKMDPASNSTDVAPDAGPNRVVEGDPEGDSEGSSKNSAAHESKDECNVESLREDQSSSNVEAVRKSVESAGSHVVAPNALDESEVTDSIDLRPYSLPSVRELFRVLVSFLDPNDKQTTDNMRIMALRIIHVALVVSGPSIARHPALAYIAEDRLCCYLFQLIRSDNMDLLQESLGVASTLLATCRGVLKLQQELFLSYLVACLHPSMEIRGDIAIHPSLYAGIPQAPKLVRPPPSQASSGRSTPVPVKDRQKLGMEGGARKPDARQAMVESIGVLSRMPTFMPELFVNYDCDEDRADLCEDVVGLLSRNALPDSATWSTTSVPPLCLDALLRYVQFISERLDEEPIRDGKPHPELLRTKRQRKKVIIEGASKFNENPKAGLGYLEAKGIIQNAQDPASVAVFLKGTSRISKKVLGEFLSKKGNEPILHAFIDLFDFSGKRVDEALRSLLETFRLPGESPLIERIVHCFSEKYCANSTPADVANKDAVFILTYAIIMLNVDQHNPNMKQKRMTLEDFARNLRGQNDGQDFSPEYLQDIYDSIKSNEIILPDEHDNQHAFDYAWRELLIKADSAGELITCATNIYDADMFAATWRPIVATLSYVFMSATDDAVFTRVVTGFGECARISARHGITQALDHLVYCLSHMTTIATELPFNTRLNAEVQAGGNSVMVSKLAIELGGDYRALLATVVLFRVVSGNEHMIDRSWKYIIRIWLNLFVNSLMPPFLSETHQERLGITAIPLQSPSQVIDRASKGSETGFLSTLTSLIAGYAADDPPEPSDEEVERTLCTIDFVKQCRMSEVFSRIAAFNVRDLSRLVEALLDQLPEGLDSSVISVRTENPALAQPPQAPAIGQRVPGSGSPQYDPAAAYILETCTVLALRDEETMLAAGRHTAEALFNILRDAQNHHAIIVSRAAFYLFKLLESGYHHDFVNIPVLLHMLSSLQQDNLAAAASLLLAGLGKCIEEAGPLRNEIMTSPDFWTILRSLAGREESGQTVFELLERGTAGSPPAITADNYEEAISLLNDFASASGRAISPNPARTDPRSRQERTEKRDATTHKVVLRGLKAVNIIHGMTERISPLMKRSHLEANEAWSAYWLPIFKALTAQCTNPCRDVRHLAFSSLQKTLHSLDLSSSDGQKWAAVFGQVLFPLVLQLLRPEVFSSDRDGMSDMRVQAASLLCKVFLQYLVQLPALGEVLDLWLKIVDIMDRLMNSGQGDSLEEAVRENLKNAMLLLASNGYLVPPPRDISKEKLWVETWKRIDRFLPDLKNDLPLDEEKPETGRHPSDDGSSADGVEHSAAETI